MYESVLFRFPLIGGNLKSQYQVIIEIIMVQIEFIPVIVINVGFIIIAEA